MTLSIAAQAKVARKVAPKRSREARRFVPLAIRSIDACRESMRETASNY
jgi:hypothetical protein